MASILEQAKELRALKHAELGRILDDTAGEKRGILAGEQRKITRLESERAALDERIAQLSDDERSYAAGAEARKINASIGNPNGVGGFTTSSRGGTYFPGRESPSFVGDLISSRNGDFEAIQRIHTHQQETRTSAGLGSFTTGHGAEVAPPGYLNVVEQARAGATFANLLHQEELPSGVSSVNLPRVLSTGGTTAAPQATQLSGVSLVDANTDLLTAQPWRASPRWWRT
jgi:hypothetical protein